MYFHNYSYGSLKLEPLGTAVPQCIISTRQCPRSCGIYSRSTYVKYVRDTDIKGIPVWEYKPPPEMFKAPVHSEYNKCFCKANTTEPHCLHDGGLHMGPCAYGNDALWISANFYVIFNHVTLKDIIFRMNDFIAMQSQHKHFKKYTNTCIDLFKIYM